MLRPVARFKPHTRGLRKTWVQNGPREPSLAPRICDILGIDLERCEVVGLSGWAHHQEYLQLSGHPSLLMFQSAHRAFGGEVIRLTS